MLFKINRIFFKNTINLFTHLKNKSDFYNQNFHVLVSKEKILIELKRRNVCQLQVKLKNSNKDKNLLVESEGSFFINSKSFFKIEKIFDSEEIKEIIFSNDEEENLLMVKGGSTKSSFGISKPDDNFPLDFSISNKIEFSVKFQEFKKLTSRTVFAVDHKGDRPILSGVAFKIEENSLFLTATDSYRLSRVVKNDLRVVKNDLKTSLLVISKEILDAINRIFEHSEKLFFSFSNNFLICKDESKEKIFKGWLIEGDYPNVERVFPKEEHFLTSILIDRLDFLSRVKRAIHMLSKNELRQIKLIFKKSDLSLIIKTESDDYFKEKIHYVNFEGQDQKLSLNIDYLREALDAFDSKEVQLKIINEEKPIIFNSKKETTYQLVLPLRSN